MSKYYLKLEAHEKILQGFTKTDGTVVPDRKYVVEERAIFKHKRFSRFYRMNTDTSESELKLYETSSLKKIKDLRELTYNYCGEIFDIYDENGKVDIPFHTAQKEDDENES